MKTLVLLTQIALLALPCFLNAQEIIKVDSVRGQALITGRISEAEARREALNDAKVEALRKAGVSEHLQTYEMLFRSEMNNDFSEFFGSDIQAELQGAVQDYHVLSWSRKIDPETNLFAIEVLLNATIIKYSNRPDPTFNVKVEGIKPVYGEGENLTFTIFATQNCYLHIFGITDKYTSLIYPNTWEAHKLFEAGKQEKFPIGNVEYPLFKSGKEPELTRIVFVFTKDPVQYLSFKGEEQITSSEAIFSWIYSLMPDRRKVDYHMFTVR